MREKILKVKKFFAFYFILPVVLDFIIECLNRKSLFAGTCYMIEKPLLFLFNVLIIMLTLSVAMFFKREIFVLSLVSMTWLVFGIANFAILHFRVTPFSAVDFTLIGSAISVSGHYLTPLNVAMILVAAAVMIVAVVCLFRKAPCYHQNVSRRAYVISGFIMAVLVVSIFWIRRSSTSVQALAENYTNISEAYENYGFVYCFTNSILDTGIGRPENYSEAAMNQLKNSLKKEENTQQTPNIVMLQLESFFDISSVKGLKFSGDPLPNFHRLQKEYTDGLLTVPTVGAGTVNTEFEVLTGMSQHDFGVCEYPYKTILKSTASESICQDLSKLGYSRHSIHNNTGTFYGRNKVFANLGFNTFTSVEYMNDVTLNPNGWANDDIIADEVIKSLDSTKGVDFTFGITVQSHGKYDGIELTQKPYVTVSGAPKGQEAAYQYYVNEIYEVDQMIGSLLDALERRQEPVILVLYGDHLPSLSLADENLEGHRNLYQTEYVTWNNYGLPVRDKDLYSYQLYSYMLQQVGIHEGTITRYHQQTEWDSEEYLEGLRMLEYDLLYGNNYIYDGENPFQETELQMGIDPVEIMDVMKRKDGYLVEGNGFTPYCHVLFRGKEIKAQWLDSHQIFVTGEILSRQEEQDEEGASLETDTDEEAFVIQVQNGDGVELSMSPPLPLRQTSLGKR